jgi:hypothetical protein
MIGFVIIVGVLLVGSHAIARLPDYIMTFCRRFLIILPFAWMGMLCKIFQPYFADPESPMPLVLAVAVALAMVFIVKKCWDKYFAAAFAIQRAKFDEEVDETDHTRGAKWFARMVVICFFVYYIGEGTGYLSEKLNGLTSVSEQLPLMVAMTIMVLSTWFIWFMFAPSFRKLFG